MTAIDQFNVTIIAADDLIAMYRELRKIRGLGARGRLDAANSDLLWLPRSAIVVSISALDAYVHHVVDERIPHMLQDALIPPDALCEKLATILPIKNAVTFREALPAILAVNTGARLAELLREKSLKFTSFQSPEKVEEAYRFVGRDRIFEDVSAMWPGPNSTAEDLKRRLSHYVDRRNQIAHEGDLEANGQPRPIQPEYAKAVRDFVGALVARLNNVIYG